jgi:PEP-CTERM motif
MSRMRLVARSLVGFVLLAVVLPGQAEATQITYSETGASFSFPAFDSSLGTLTGERVNEWFSSVGTVQVRNLSSTEEALGWIDQTYQVYGDPEWAEPAVANIYLPPDSSRSISFDYQEGGAVGGPGFVFGQGLTCHLMTGGPFPDPFTTGRAVIDSYTDTVTITMDLTYTYDAGVYPTVPEPSTVVGAGLAVLAGLGYGWKRRRRGG